MTRTQQACRMLTAGSPKPRPQPAPQQAPPRAQAQPAPQWPRGFEDPNRRRNVVNINSPVVVA